MTEETIQEWVTFTYWKISTSTLFEPQAVKPSIDKVASIPNNIFSIQSVSFLIVTVKHIYDIYVNIIQYSLEIYNVTITHLIGLCDWYRISILDLKFVKHKDKPQYSYSDHIGLSEYSENQYNHKYFQIFDWLLVLPVHSFWTPSFTIFRILNKICLKFVFVLYHFHRC